MGRAKYSHPFPHLSAFYYYIFGNGTIKLEHQNLYLCLHPRNWLMSKCHILLTINKQTRSWLFLWKVLMEQREETELIDTFVIIWIFKHSIFKKATSSQRWRQKGAGGWCIEQFLPKKNVLYSERYSCEKRGDGLMFSVNHISEFSSVLFPGWSLYGLYL